MQEWRTTTSTRSYHNSSSSRRFRNTVFAVILLLVGAYPLFNQIPSTAAGSATPSVTRNTVYTWQIPTGTGEGSVGINPTNANNMVYHAIGLPDFFPFYSTDGGSTWTKSSSPGLLDSVHLDPWTTYDSQGNVYASTFKGDGSQSDFYNYPYLAKSTNGGANFALVPSPYANPSVVWTMPDGSLKPSCAMPGAGAVDFPKIVADKGLSSPFRDYVYVVSAVGVNSTGSPSCGGRTGFMRSLNGGITWDIHRVIQGVLAPNNLVVAPNGTIYFGVPYAGGGTLLVYSHDAGLTWSTKAIPLAIRGRGQWVAVSKVNSNDLYIAFEATHADNSVHIYLISSTNGGATWSSPVRLDDVLPDDATDHTLPSIDVAPNGRVFVAWRDYRNTPSRTQYSNTTDIYAHSSANPDVNIRVSGSTGRYCGAYSPCYQVTGNDYFQVVSGNSNDYVAYSLDEDANSWPEAYFATVTYPYSVTTTIKDSTRNTVTSVVIGTSVHGTATLSGGSGTITGTVTYMRFSSSDCTGTSTDENVIIGQGNIIPDSADFLTTAVGAISYKASYGGDSNNPPTTSPCQTLTVTKASPSLTTSLSATSILPGGSVFDTATLSGSFQASGSVTYSLFDDGTCSGPSTVVSIVSVTNSIVPDSEPRTFDTAGFYSWNALYSGDTNNNGATSPCEPLTVSSLPVSTLTSAVRNAQGATVTSIVVGTAVHGTATISGGSGTITGTVTYALFRNGVCTGTGETVSTVTIGTGNTVPESAPITPSPSGSYSFHASYSGDANNGPTISPCKPLTVADSSGDQGTGERYYLEISFPYPGLRVWIDGIGYATNASNLARVQVDYGLHTILVEPRIPAVPGPIQLGLTNTFIGWADGSTDNPRSVMIVQDTVLTAQYSLTIETSFYFFVSGAAFFGLVLTAAIVRRRRASRLPFLGEGIASH